METLPGEQGIGREGLMKSDNNRLYQDRVTG